MSIMSMDQTGVVSDESEAASNLRSVIVRVGDATESVNPPTDDRDPFEAVMAHGALNSMAVLLDALRIVSDHPANLDEEQVRLLAVAAEQGRMVMAALLDLDLRLPLGATGVLADLDEGARLRHQARDVTPATMR
ncbi:MAG: hypothetical protein NVS3B21_23530 [Acidimicrobiales bacterium]